MVSVPLNIPEGINASEAQTLLAVKLLELNRVTLGKAAEIAGYSKPAFIEVLTKYGVPIIAYPAEDLEQELHL